MTKWFIPPPSRKRCPISHNGSNRPSSKPRLFFAYWLYVFISSFTHFFKPYICVWIPLTRVTGYMHTYPHCIASYVRLYFILWKYIFSCVWTHLYSYIKLFALFVTCTFLSSYPICLLQKLYHSILLQIKLNGSSIPQTLSHFIQNVIQFALTEDDYAF